MHNIRTNFNKFYRICKELFEKDVNSRNNFDGTLILIEDD